MTNRDKIEVPDPLAVEDLIGSKLNNKRKLARLITQCRGMFFPAFVLGWVTKYEYCNTGFLLEAGSRVPAPVYFKNRVPGYLMCEIKIKNSKKKIINLNKT